MAQSPVHQESKPVTPVTEQEASKAEVVAEAAVQTPVVQAPIQEQPKPASETKSSQRPRRERRVKNDPRRQREEPKARKETETVAPTEQKPVETPEKTGQIPASEKASQSTAAPEQITEAKPAGKTDRASAPRMTEMAKAVAAGNHNEAPAFGAPPVMPVMDTPKTRKHRQKDMSVTSDEAEAQLRKALTATPAQETPKKEHPAPQPKEAKAKVEVDSSPAAEAVRQPVVQEQKPEQPAAKPETVTEQPVQTSSPAPEEAETKVEQKSRRSRSRNRAHNDPRALRRQQAAQNAEKPVAADPVSNTETEESNS